MVKGGQRARGLVETQLEMLAPAVTPPCAVAVLVHASAARARPGRVTRKGCRADAGCGSRAPEAFSETAVGFSQDHVPRR